MENLPKINNFIAGKYVEPSSGKYMPVENPATGEHIAQVALSTAEDVEAAVAAAEKGFKVWSEMTVKTRALILMKWYQLMTDKYKQEIIDSIVKEHGKNAGEALGEYAKGNETLEYACSLPQLIQGKILEVSRGVICQDRKDPVGIVASIVPFNFPYMVPMWTIPIALGCGNAVILKPSEKVPMTMSRVAEILVEAGVPEGVFQVVNGAIDAVEAICSHKSIRAVSFVGSTPIAEKVATKSRSHNKKCLALGGAKNHLIVAPDRDLEMATTDIVASFTGCTGQRCMAASALLTIGEQPELLELMVKKAGSMKPGQANGQIGPVIDKGSRDRIVRYIDEAEKGGAKILLDGRTWLSERNDQVDDLLKKGYWVGPTIIVHSNKDDAALHDEIFGPVISVFAVKTKEEAIAIENASPFGNAACIYTSSGGLAEWFIKRFHTGMMGINIGVPVPREPFSFGGMNGSKFGDCDITGDGGIEFFTQRKKITSKWSLPSEKNWMN